MRNSWPVYLLLGISVAMYWPSWYWLADNWLDGGTYSHGPLMVIVVMYLLADALYGFSVRPSSPDFRFALPLLAVASVWLLSYLARVQIGQEILLPLIMLLACGLAFGGRLARAVLFPIAMLYFAIPVWDLINYPLQIATASALEFVFGILGIPVNSEDTLVTVRAGVFRIAEGCSGMRYLLVGAILSLSYGYLEFRHLSSRLYLLLAALIVAALTNWIRVSAIVYLGDATDMQHPWVSDHVSLGWYLFAAASLILWPVARRLHRREQGFSDRPIQQSESPTKPLASGRSLMPAVAILALAPAYILLPLSTPYAAGTAVGHSAPPVGWQGPLPVGSAVSWRPEFNGATAQALAQYTSPGGIITAYNVFYATQNQQSELVGNGNRLQGKFSIVGRSELELTGTRVLEITARESGDQFWLLFYAYWVDGDLVSSPLGAKIREALAGLKRRSGSGLMALGMACQQRDCSAARAELSRFSRALPFPTVSQITD